MKKPNILLRIIFVILALTALSYAVSAQSPVSTGSVPKHKKAALNRKLSLSDYELMVVDTVLQEVKDKINTIASLLDPSGSYLNNTCYKYEFEFNAGSTTYSVTNAVVMGTLSVTSFSVQLPSGYYKLSQVFLADIGTSLASGYNLYVYDSIPQSQTDNVVISNNQTYSKRNLIYSIPLTSQIINDSGRLFYNGTVASYGQTYTSNYLFSGTFYYLVCVAGGTPYANSGAKKNIRLMFQKVGN